MYEIIELIKNIGNVSLDTFWFPLLIWTLCCALAFLFLKTRDKLNPLFHYHLRTAALLSLPLGIGVAALMSKIPEWFASSNLETAFFVVQNPIEIVPNTGSGSAEIALTNWQEPSFFIGITTLVIALVSIVMIGRLISNYVALKSLYKNLSLTELQSVSSNTRPSSKSSVKLAFHDHPLVPFTFGWKQPVIVLPKLLQHEPEKLDMALQHELTHIKRGDYLLQLALSMIESLFWFHPLIRYGNQEIDTYREISCDQEVLSKSDFSIKSYANLLYELVPLNTGVGKLSVSMAVKNSTLKKRIKTMKYHKLHKASFRQSIFFLFLMILGITLPIACSDLRGPQGLSEEEIANTKIVFDSPTITVNGVEGGVWKQKQIDAMAYNGFVMMLGDYGSFVFSLTRFEGATQAGTISGNKASFTINEMEIEITSESSILPEVTTPIYARHFMLQETPDFRIFSMIPKRILENSKDLEDFATLKAIPGNFPESGKLPSDQGNSSSEQDDFFVVVEEMPKLKGGMAALHAKLEYPDMARRAGIEGRVTIQFIVDEQGNVEDPKVVRGIGGGADEEALRVVREAQFTPGVQRGRPVRVQYALSVNFRLENSDFTSSQPEPVPNTFVINVQNDGSGTITGTVKSNDGKLLSGANVIIEGTNRGTSTNPNGKFSFTNLPEGQNTIRVTYVGFKPASVCITGCS